MPKIPPGLYTWVVMFSLFLGKILDPKRDEDPWPEWLQWFIDAIFARSCCIWLIQQGCGSGFLAGTHLQHAVPPLEFLWTVHVNVRISTFGRFVWISNCGLLVLSVGSSGRTGWGIKSFHLSHTHLNGCMVHRPDLMRACVCSVCTP